MLTENGMTPEAEARLLREAEEAEQEVAKGNFYTWKPGDFSTLSTQPNSERKPGEHRSISKKKSMQLLERYEKSRVMA